MSVVVVVTALSSGPDAQVFVPHRAGNVQKGAL